MNNTYFNKDIFPKTPFNQNNNQQQIKQTQPYNINIPLEQAYLENILQLNKGKQIEISLALPNENTNIKETGILEQPLIEHIIISEPSTGKFKIIPMKYINYITFIENINYKEDFYPNNWFINKNLL